MTTIVISTFFILCLAVATAGLVVVGIEGRGRVRAPRLADRLARVAQHLNGDGRPPRRLARWYHAHLRSH